MRQIIWALALAGLAAPASAARLDFVRNITFPDLQTTGPTGAQRFTADTLDPSLPDAIDVRSVTSSFEALATHALFGTFAGGVPAFGGRASLQIIDTGPRERRVFLTGAVEARFNRTNAPTSAIEFSIENGTFLELNAPRQSLPSAKISFGAFALGSSGPSDFLFLADSSIALSYADDDDSPDITREEFGPQSIPLAFSETREPGRFTDEKVRLEVLPLLQTIDLSDLAQGQEVLFTYFWNVDIMMTFDGDISAGFLDPITDQGLLSFTTTGLEEVSMFGTGGGTGGGSNGGDTGAGGDLTPAAIPLPPAALLLLGALGWLRGLRPRG